MNKLTLLIFIVVCAVVLSFTGLYAATKDAPGTPEKSAGAEPSAQPAGTAPESSPGMGAMPMKGHGKGHGAGAMQMHGRGMMGAGCGMMGAGCGMMASGCGMKPASPITLDDAKAMVDGRLAFLRNPNLKMGGVTDQGEGFEVEIVTRDGSLVDKMFIHKAMGWMRSIY